MFCSEVSNGTSILKNNTVFQLKPIQFSTTFKHEHYGKSNTLVLAILQMNYKRSLNKGITKYFCKISLKNFENLGNIELYSFVCKFVFFCTFKSFFIQLRIRTRACTHVFKSVLCSFIALPLLEAPPN